MLVSKIELVSSIKSLITRSDNFLFEEGSIVVY
jgi:hypothetical protein